LSAERRFRSWVVVSFPVRASAPGKLGACARHDTQNVPFSPVPGTVDLKGMGNYRVVLSGRNLWLERDGKVELHGFYATSFVEAATPCEAEGRARAELDSAPSSAVLRNLPSDPPAVDVSECAPIRPSEVPTRRSSCALFRVEPGEFA